MQRPAGARMRRPERAQPACARCRGCAAIYSLAPGTSLRLAEIVGLNVGDVFAPDGTPRHSVRIRPAIAKDGRAGDVFLPDALVPKLRKFRAQPMRTCPESSGFLEPAGPRRSC